MTSAASQKPYKRIRRKQNKIRDRIRPIVERLSARWLKFCTERHSRRVVGVARRDPVSLCGHDTYGLLKRVQYFDVKLALDEPYRDGPLAAGCELGDRLQKAILTYNTCIHACMGFWEYLHQVLEGHRNFVKLEAKYAHVRPRLILFPSSEVPGCETVFWHHYIVVTFRHGISFVLDFAGYQFGFSKVFYTLKEFETKVLDRSEEPVVEDMWPLLKQMRQDAMSEERNVHQRKAAQLMDLAWELLMS